MKRREFIRELNARGCFLARHGNRHDIYENPAAQRRSSVPRHAELADTLCSAIRRQLGL